MKERPKIIYIIIFCIYLTAVGVLCFIRPSDLPEMKITTFLGIPIDKILHFLMFLPYPILSGTVFLENGCSLPRGVVIMAILAVTGIGISYGTEVIQAHTGYRSYETGDFHADMAGITTGSIISLTYLTYLRLKK